MHACMIIIFEISFCSIDEDQLMRRLGMEDLFENFKVGAKLLWVSTIALNSSTFGIYLHAQGLFDRDHSIHASNQKDANPPADWLCNCSPTNFNCCYLEPSHRKTLENACSNRC